MSSPHISIAQASAPIFVVHVVKHYNHIAVYVHESLLQVFILGELGAQSFHHDFLPLARVPQGHYLLAQSVALAWVAGELYLHGHVRLSRAKGLLPLVVLLDVRVGVPVDDHVREVVVGQRIQVTPEVVNRIHVGCE